MESPISAGVFDGFTWIRCEGKGSFRSSPELKRYAELRVGAGERVLVIDLAACTAMDSTFMGTLAGLAMKLGKCGGGVVQIAGVSERNRRSLEDLGLDFLVEIEPEQAVWRQQVDAVRGSLELVCGSALLPNGTGAARHVLDAHRVLAGTSEANRERVRGVVEVLEAGMAGGGASSTSTSPW